MLCRVRVLVAVVALAACARTAADIVEINSDSTQHTENTNMSDEAFLGSGDRVFVAIAAFLDPELVPTVDNLLEMAKWPHKLDFGVLLQEDPADAVEFPWEHDERFKVQRIPYLDSQGVGWARHTGAKLYGGQRYLLQLDSHHRFEQDWDQSLLHQLWRCVELGSPKPILSTYLSSYEPGRRYRGGGGTRAVVSERYYDTGKVRFVGAVARPTKDPHPSGVISAHFIFTYATWLDEVPYDPIIYFDGEEDTLSARSWTHGWDIYYPAGVQVYHQYGRTHQKKHWDVHPNWGIIKRDSEAHVRQLLQQEPTTKDFGVFGLGTARSYDAFQEFSGLYFPKWHLGARARAGDPTAKESTPPPDSWPQLCLYVVPNGEIVNRGQRVWEDRTGPHWWTFEEQHDRTASGGFLLYDKQRHMYLEITNASVSWGELTKATPQPIDIQWNKIYDVQSVHCIGG